MNMSPTMKLISALLSIVVIALVAWLVYLQSLAPQYERTGHQSLEQQESYGEVQVESYEQWRERQGGAPTADAPAADAPAADAPAADTPAADAPAADAPAADAPAPTVNE